MSSQATTFAPNKLSKPNNPQNNSLGAQSAANIKNNQNGSSFQQSENDGSKSVNFDPKQVSMAKPQPAKKAIYYDIAAGRGDFDNGYSGSDYSHYSNNNGPINNHPRRTNSHKSPNQKYQNNNAQIPKSQSSPTGLNSMTNNNDHNQRNNRNNGGNNNNRGNDKGRGSGYQGNKRGGGNRGQNNKGDQRSVQLGTNYSPNIPRSNSDIPRK